MTNRAISLDVIRVEKPCPADWEAMHGDDRVRFCDHCSLHVYNLSGMAREDAERIVSEREGRLCVRFYQRLDGTVITNNCRGGWKLAIQSTNRWMRAAIGAALCAILSPLGIVLAKEYPKQPEPLMGDVAMPQPALMGKVSPSTQPVMLGEIAAPTTRPATQPATQPTTQPTTGPAR